jgi:hypothetical protein
MKREEIKAIFPDATDEQLSKILDINGADVEKVKAKITALEADIKDKKDAFDKLNTELEALKTANASGEDWKAKFEALQAENVAKEKQAEADRILAEKNENIKNRFSTVLGEKKFNHDAIKAEYLKKFSEALDLKENQGRSDAEIFHELTKDDGAAFTGVTTVRLAGGTQRGTSGKYTTAKEILDIKDGATRRAEMMAHPHLFPELNSK